MIEWSTKSTKALIPATARRGDAVNRRCPSIFITPTIALIPGKRRYDRRQGRLGAKDLQGGKSHASQPAQDGEVRRRVQHDLPQRGRRPLELEGQICCQAYLCKY